MKRLLLVLALLLQAMPLGGVFSQDHEALLARYAPAMRPDFEEDLLTESKGRPFYTLTVDLTVNDEVVRFNGVQTVSLTNTSTEPWDTVVFRLYPNLNSYGGDMTVSNVQVDGQPVTPELDASRTVLTLSLPEPLAPGALAEITLDFETVITPGRELLYNQFSYLEDVLAAPNFYPMLSVYEPDAGWWQEVSHPQGDAVYSETGFYDVWLTAPASLVVASSGVTLAETPADDGTVTYEIIAPLMRDFAVMASENYTVLSQDVDGVTLNVISEESEAWAQAAMDRAVESLRLYDTAFGEYPFAELDIVETPTAAGGIEYPGLIVAAEDVWNPARDFFTIVIVHEVAHQWWYSLVGNDQTADPWMDESLTQYTVAYYYNEVSGTNAADKFLSGFRAALEKRRQDNEDMVIGLSVAEYGAGDDYYESVYSKGPLFFDLLAELVGEEALQAALQDYFATFRYEVATPADMLASFEASLGRDNLDGVFRQWIGEFPGLQ